MRKIVRSIRDPIHNNIPIGEVAGAIIDTLTFQRLRYVRQNGLLHFVFPGATHTRFAHSIGAMHVASRVWAHLEQRFRPSSARDYVGAVFELAALLHDVGHCAFSHSIEKITIDDEPLLGRVNPFFERWGEKDLLADFLKVKPEKDGKPIKHEQIGLLLTKRIFAEERVRTACQSSLKVPGDKVGADVISLMEFGIPPTAALNDALAELGAAPEEDGYLEKVMPPDFVRDMTQILSSLVSGTLDVDRMDYLLRDSFFCGVAYGRIDLEHVIGCLGVATYKGRTYLTVREKAVLAVDDLFWSRHQMFLQVYGHKTNVALDRMLQLAIPDMIGDLDRLKPPESHPEYLEFTDDYLLSRIISLCAHGKKLAGTTYGRTLAQREVPKHLDELRLGDASSDLSSPAVIEMQRHLAETNGVSPEMVLTAISANEIVKGAALPKVLIDGVSSGDFSLERYEKRSSLFAVGHEGTPLPARYATAHFFVDRRELASCGPGRAK